MISVLVSAYFLINAAAFVAGRYDLHYPEYLNDTTCRRIMQIMPGYYVGLLVLQLARKP
jgi:hypothetical protein